jgi:hypothetical protein
MKYLILILISVFFISCGDKTNDTDNRNNSSNNETDDTTSLSPQEAFSYVLVNQILNSDDEDLELFLENEIFPVVSKSEKVTIDEISSSLFILTYFEGDVEKNLLIQKFYTPVKDEVTFVKSETSITPKKQFLK